MGGFFSAYEFMEKEQQTWLKHKLQFDQAVRGTSYLMLDAFRLGTKMKLGYVDSKWGKISFQHWFVSNQEGTAFFEFGSANLDIYNATVTVRSGVRQFTIHQEADITEEVIERMHLIIGLSNYSLCLRNCEHVANYVFRNRWFSTQLYSTSPVRKWFTQYLTRQAQGLINSFPYSDGEYAFNPLAMREEKIYTFNDSPIFTYSKVDYYLDPGNNDTYNIAVIGPTGAGKSNLINIMFNKNICVSRQDHESVTQDSCFVHGFGNIYNSKAGRFEHRRIIVADTVGLCDTNFDAAEILNLIKGRVSSNFRKLDMVIIVYRADRLMPEVKSGINNVLDWLGYNKENSEGRFVFVATFAEDSDEEDIARLTMQAASTFGIKSSHRRGIREGELIKLIQYVGFPKERHFSDGRQQQITEFLNELHAALTQPSDSTNFIIPNDAASWCSIL